MITQLNGKVLDENGKTIPSATVFLSNEKGGLINEKARVSSDVNGNYSLLFSAPIPNFATGQIKFFPIGRYITVKYTGYPDRTVALPSFLFDEDKKGTGNFDVNMELKTQTTPEVTVTENRSKFMCEKEGGTWDETTKTCKLPEKNWWSKYKWWVIGGLALTATATTLYLVLKRDK
jgi:hypothetical protein